MDLCKQQQQQQQQNLCERFISNVYACLVLEY